MADDPQGLDVLLELGADGMGPVAAAVVHDHDLKVDLPHAVVVGAQNLE